MNIHWIGLAWTVPPSPADFWLKDLLIYGIWPVSLVCVWLWHRYATRRKVEAIRQDISRDFHDELGSKITIIRTYSELARRSPDIKLALPHLARVDHATAHLTRVYRNLIWSLKPEHRNLSSLIGKLEDTAEELIIGDRPIFQVHYESSGENTELTPAEWRHLLALLQEALHNAVKHSNAEQVNLTIEKANGSIEVQLTDDGEGFDLQNPGLRGNGLDNMAYRAARTGGKYQLYSDEAGTRLTLTLPLKKYSASWNLGHRSSKGRSLSV